MINTKFYWDQYIVNNNEAHQYIFVLCKSLFPFSCQVLGCFVVLSPFHFDVPYCVRHFGSVSLFTSKYSWSSYWPLVWGSSFRRWSWTSSCSSPPRPWQLAAAPGRRARPRWTTGLDPGPVRTWPQTAWRPRSPSSSCLARLSAHMRGREGNVTCWLTPDCQDDQSEGGADCRLRACTILQHFQVGNGIKLSI